MAAPTTRVFISYAHRYRDWASALHDNLELCTEGAPRSLGVFLDERDLESGSSWVGQLEAGLDRADHLVLIATPEAVASPRVADEVEAFVSGRRDWSRGHCHVALLVDTPLPPFVAMLQHVDFRQHDEPAYRAGLKRLLAGVIGEPVEPPAGIAVPAAPGDGLDPELRKQLVAWLEPVLSRRLARKALGVALGLKPGTLEGHPSSRCCASALLVAATGDDDAVQAARRVVKVLAEELAEDDPEHVARLEPVRDALDRLRLEDRSESGLLGTYLEKVDRDHLTLVPYFQHGAELELLDRVYVQLHLQPQLRERALPESAAPGVDQPFALRDLLDLEVEEHPWITRRWVVRGDPGAGKTTLLRHLAGSLARETHPAWIPVFESLPRLMRHREWLFDRLARNLARAGHPARGLTPVLEREAREGRLLLLLDGLDEVPREDRDDAEGLLRDLSAHWPRTPLVVSSRPIGYRRPGGEFRELDLLPFDRVRRQRFLARWFGRKTGEPDDAQAARALATLEADASLIELAGNPLYLTLMALLLEEGRAPHKNRTRLYDQVFGLLLEGRYRPGGEPMEAQEATRGVLRYLGEGMTRDNRDAEPVAKLEARLYRPEADPLREPLERVPRWRRSVRPFLEELAERTGILGAHDGPEADWRFWHRTFREALAAETLEQRYSSDGPDAVLTHACDIAGDESRWAEPYALLVGRIESPDALVKALVEENRALGLRAVATAQGLRDATLSEILELSEKPEERAEVFGRIPELVDEAERALALLDRLRRRTTNGHDLYFLAQVVAEVGRRWDSAAARAEELQARLFDHIPPPPEGLYDTVETPHDGPVDLWCDVPAGTFQMGTPEAEEGWDGEWPVHPVAITAPFRIAAVPVTNAQYQAFDPGHRPEPWQGVAEDELPHHPAVNVNWYEAQSFCRWLGGAVPRAKGARLPTEEEWEYACRAGTATRYWSGEQEADLERVGWYDENSGRRTHRVGEKLANAFGLYDVHGNVFEWTPSPLSTDFSARQDGVTLNPGHAGQAEAGAGGERVVRGGGCWSDAGSARCAFRYRDAPQAAVGDLGFRVLLPAAPSSRP